MKKFRLFLIAVFYLCFTMAAEPVKMMAAQAQETTQTYQLHECTDDKLGVKFLCDPDWEIQSGDNVMLIIINKNPSVTLTVAKSDTPVVFMEQLTNPVLQELGQYQDGFRTQIVDLGGQQAIQVIGKSKEIASAGLIDFYAIHDINLYSILFLVDPRDSFADYEALFGKIKESFQFL